MVTPANDAFALFPERYTIRSRGACQWLTLRRFASGSRVNGLRQFKAWKSDLDAAPIGLMAAEIALAWLRMMGPTPGWLVAAVGCGHSRRDDCMSERIADGAAERLGLSRLRPFRRRWVMGSSHPKEFAKLPALEFAEVPAAPVLLVDDLTTSGWHIAEALALLRSSGQQASAVVWLNADPVAGSRDDWRSKGKSAPAVEAWRERKPQRPTEGLNL